MSTMIKKLWDKIYLNENGYRVFIPEKNLGKVKKKLSRYKFEVTRGNPFDHALRLKSTIVGIDKKAGVVEVEFKLVDNGKMDADEALGIVFTEEEDDEVLDYE